MHKDISNARNDFHHKISYALIKDNQLIALEDLNVKGMMKNHKLAKHIGDAGWSQLIRFIEYKADWYGRKAIKVDRFFPSSKVHHECGYYNADLKLSEREWFCPKCKKWIKRDLNAANGILKEALIIINGGEDASLKVSGSCQHKLKLRTEKEAHVL